MKFVVMLDQRPGDTFHLLTWFIYQEKCYKDTKLTTRKWEINYMRVKKEKHTDNKIKGKIIIMINNIVSALKINSFN